MLSANDVFRDLEAARAAREAEVRVIQNLLASQEDGDKKSALRRSLVLVTYAHLEGFCKVALDMYATTVNSFGVSCTDAIAPLVAATLHRAFGALRNIQSKHPAFDALPDDTALHMAWREQQFVERVAALMSAKVEISDDIINTEANLSPDVLKRNMYRLGLNFASVDVQRGSMNELLGRRNAISHGELLDPTAADVERYVASAFRIMQFVQGEIFDALTAKAYLKPKAA